VGETKNRYSRLRVSVAVGDYMSCGHFRAVDPARTLHQKYGTEYQVIGAVLLEEMESIQTDYLILQRRLEQWLPGVIEKLIRRGVTVVFEIDDNIHRVPPESPAYPFYKPGTPAIINAPKVIGACMGMTVSTHELQSFYRRYQRNIHVLENQIDLHLRDWDTPMMHKPKNRLIVGWSGASQHQTDTPLLKNVMRRIVDRYPFVDIAIYANAVYAYEVARSWNIPPDRLIILPAVSFEHYPYWLGYFDIGVAPVSNSEFNRCKCLDSDTLIPTELGILPISELKPGMKVWNGSRYTKVLAIASQPKELGVRVVTKTGHVIKMTMEHRVLTLRGERTASELRVGDMIAMLRARVASSMEHRPEEMVAAAIGFCSTIQPNIQVPEWVSRKLEEIGAKPVQNVSAWYRKHAKPRGGLPIQVSACSGNGAAQFVALVISLCGRFSENCVVLKSLDESAAMEMSMLLESLEVWSDRVPSRSEDSPKYHLNIRASFLSMLMKKSRWFSEWLSPEMKEYLSRHTIRGRYDIRIPSRWYEPIERIEYYEIEHPVDIQVDGEWFQAGSFYSHNSFLKPLEYGARKVPSICSKIAPYARLERRYPGCILLADSDGEWENAICTLIEDESLRHSMAQRMHDIVHSDFSLYKNCDRWIETWDLIRERYLAGDAGPDLSIPAPKPPSRNDPCPCGSENKYSKCCYPAWG